MKSLISTTVFISLPHLFPLALFPSRDSRSQIYVKKSRQTLNQTLLSHLKYLRDSKVFSLCESLSITPLTEVPNDVHQRQRSRISPLMIVNAAFSLAQWGQRKHRNSLEDTKNLTLIAGRSIQYSICVCDPNETGDSPLVSHSFQSGGHLFALSSLRQAASGGRGAWGGGAPLLYLIVII